MKKQLLIAVLALPLLVWQCGVSRQLTEAKALGNCQYNLVSTDSVSLSGYDIREFRSIQDINPVRYPRIATGLLTRNVPLSARINLEIFNPTNQNAAIDQLEYRVLLAGQELANGFVDQRIAVARGGGKTVVPIRISTNAYQLVTDGKTRDAFTQFIQNLAGNANTKPSKLTIKIKPTLGVGNKSINYPGYITIEKEVTNKIFQGK